MRALLRYATAGACGAALAFIFGDAHSNAVFSARGSFPPDLIFFLKSSGAQPMLAMATGGAVLGLASALAVEGRLLNALLVLLNPLTVFVLAEGLPGCLCFAAMIPAAKAFASLPDAKEPTSIISFGLVLALGPFLANPMLAICLALIALGALVSPWGREDRRLTGFATVTASPLLLALVSTSYLLWLFGSPGAVKLAGAPRLPPADQSLILAGATLIGVVARFRSKLPLAAAAFSGAGLLYAARPSMVAGALSHIAGAMNAP